MQGLHRLGNEVNVCAMQAVPEPPAGSSFVFQAQRSKANPPRARSEKMCMTNEHACALRPYASSRAALLALCMVMAHDF